MLVACEFINLWIIHAAVMEVMFDVLQVKVVIQSGKDFTTRKVLIE